MTIHTLQNTGETWADVVPIEILELSSSDVYSLGVLNIPLLPTLSAVDGGQVVWILSMLELCKQLKRIHTSDEDYAGSMTYIVSTH